MARFQCHPICFGLLIGLLAATQGCRSPRRGTDGDEDGKTLNVRASGMDDEDKARTNLIYELNGCTDSKVVGSIKSDGRIAFVAKSLKASQTCGMTVRSLELANDTRFSWIDGTAGSLYVATGITVRTDIDGTLTGTAALSKNYQLRSANFFSLTLTTTFPDDLVATQNYLAEVSCQPHTQSVGIFKQESPRSGTFEFSEPLNAGEEKTFSCTLAAVWVDRALKYRGFFTADGSPISFKAKAGASTKLPTSGTMALQVIDLNQTQNPESIIVNTVEGSCAPDELFDIKAGKCRKK